MIVLRRKEFNVTLEIGTAPLILSHYLSLSLFLGQPLLGRISLRLGGLFVSRHVLLFYHLPGHPRTVYTIYH